MKKEGMEMPNDVRACACTAVLLLSACGNLPGMPPTPATDARAVPAPQASASRAFPGAVGYGTETVAGRNGRIIKVTSLANEGAGTLRAALEARGPRVIVFEVGGIIDLDKKDLAVREPFVTIAGQTAPSPGITLIRGGMYIGTHDVLMQHVRFRIGDAGEARKSGFERDVSIAGKHAYNVVVDHCSFAWGTDENLSVSGERYDGPGGTARHVTLSHNIIAQGLYDGPHSKGRHSMGTLIHDYVQDVAVIGNLYAHNNDRNPWFKAEGTGVVVNNYIYNPGTWAVRVGYNPKEWVGRTQPGAPSISVVGNVLQYGANTAGNVALVGSGFNNGNAFVEDNIATDRLGRAVAQVGLGVTKLDRALAWVEGLRPLPASEVREAVLTGAGARPRDRDSVDRQLVADIRAGKGVRIDSQTEAGGYPQAATVRRPLDVPTADVDHWLAEMARALE
jgi:hypothetical protein